MRKEEMKKPALEIFRALVFSLLYISLVSRLSPVLLLLTPIPFIIIGYRNNSYTGIVGILILAVIIAFMAGFKAGISMFITVAPVTFAIQTLLKKREGNNRILLVATFILLGSLLISLYIEKDKGMDLKAEMEKSFDSVLELQLDMMEDLDLDKYKKADVEDTLRSGYKYIMTVFPALLILSSLLAVYFNLKISTYILKRTGSVVDVPQFYHFKLPNSFLLGSAVMFIAVYIIEKMKLPYAKSLSYNISVLVSFLFLLQGLSLLSFMFYGKGRKKGARIILILLIMMVLPINGILMVFGFLDSIFDFRKIRNKTL